MRKEEVTTKGKPLYYLNWDNEFSVRFNIRDKQINVQHVPNNIFSVELPEISVSDLMENDVDWMLKVTLRSTTDGSVESEVFNTLLRNSFDVELSLQSPNITVWKYIDCSVEKIGFSPLVGRKNRSNPFNYILYIKVKQAVYNGDNQIIEFGIPEQVASKTIEEKGEDK